MEQQIQTTVQSASKSRRFFNLLIDEFLLQIGIFIIVSLLLRLIFGEAFPSSNFWVNYLISLTLIFLYYFLFELVLQKTPAKFITGTKVVMDDGSKPDAGVIAKRSLIRFVPFEPISLYTGKEIEKKGTWWHDRWTKTRVIKSKS
jgi:uncharacterized RDD family membrane protein YckC